MLSRKIQVADRQLTRRRGRRWGGEGGGGEGQSSEWTVQFLPAVQEEGMSADVDVRSSCLIGADRA